MRTIEYGDTSAPADLGDTVKLQNQELPVVACEQTGAKMLNIDADQLASGDLSFIKKLGLTISNPDTDKPIALGVDYTPNTFGHRIAKFFHPDIDEPEEEGDSDYDSDDDDDSGFFSSAGASIGAGIFGGGSSFGGFSGGGFSGGGASGGF